MMTFKLSLLIGLVMSAAGCAIYANAAAMNEMLEQQPMRFSMGRDSAAVAWARATRWFEEFGRPKIDIKTSSMVRSEYTNVPNGKYRLQIERTDGADSVEFVIGHDWQPSIAASEEDRERPLRLVRGFAYTVRTGDTPSAWLKRHEQ